ncbi:Fanconi anemia core complex-associated protein 100 [Tachyglossus aculeatus]|uniref:Fanconi anemia core complex-associated protein 100 n=1 Tax=Tachyglossus aculeatus TaxID=9261 RepID=UPI0018F488BE|nr:Fanconi anemia core complex-associated protein 100 [Tachyglossus aculeatus]
MADDDDDNDGQRVRYLAALGCPVGGPEAGTARVLCHQDDVYLASGTEFVYVYERAGKRIRDVYRFPDRVWHLELLALPRELYILCARNGIFRLRLDRPNRSEAGAGGGEDRDDASVVGPEACVLADPTLCAFAILATDEGDGVVTLAPGPAGWTVSLFGLPLPGPGHGLPTPKGRVVLPDGGGDPRTPPAPRFVPVLCCAGGPLSGGSKAAAVVLCGLPDGRLYRVALPAPAADPVRLVHHLEEPVVFIGALKTAGPGRDCVVAVGRGGKVAALRAGELREYQLPGPVLCAACGAGSRLFVGTRSDLAAVDLAAGDGGRPARPGDLGDPPAGLPAGLAPASLRICGVVTLAVSAGTPEGEAELLALTAKGRLMTCRPGPRAPGKGTVARSGRRIKDLLSGIGDVSERVGFLRKAVEQRNRALAGLNEALNVSCALLGGRRDPRPLGCSARALWTPPGPRAALALACVLHNAGAFGLDGGWTLCVRLAPAGRPRGGGLSGPATYTVPLGPLPPGGRTEATLPLGPGPGRPPALPVAVSCSLFYSLGPPGPEGVCLPLSRHSVDVLQCLRFPGPAPAPGPTPDPVDAFLGRARARAREEPPAARYVPPSVASIKVSARLLRSALKDRCPEAPLCCGTLRWLLAENDAADAVRTRAVAAVRALAPDGNDVHLLVREVAVTELCPAGPIEAVEIQMESVTLANLCCLHHAVVQRFLTLVMDQASRESDPPHLRLHCLRQIHSDHETLLKQVRSLRDHPGREDDAGAAAEELLRLYRRLRNPGLVLL